MRTLLFALVAISLTTGSAVAAAGKFNKVVRVEEKAPTFEGIPAVLGDKGTTVSLEDLKDDVVVLVFLANHCPFVTVIEDRLIDFTRDYQGKGVKVVGLCVTPLPEKAEQSYQDYAVQDTMEKIRKRVKEKGYNFVYARDDSQKVGRDYGVVVTPQIFVLDKARTIRYMGTLDDSINDESKVTRSYVREAVDAILAGKPVEVTETRATGCGVNYLK